MDSWGIELWDQFDNVIKYLEKGAVFCDGLDNFFRERCSIEEEYAKNLRKLARNALSKKRDDLCQSLSTNQAFLRLLQEQQDIAGQHELIAENIRDRVTAEVQALSKSIREQKRNSTEDYNRNKKMVDKAAESAAKAFKKYEDASEIGRRARDSYQKANEDINLSRAQVEKTRIIMGEKNALCEHAKREYHHQVGAMNDTRNQFYEVNAPQVFQELQNFEESRIDRTKECLTTYIDCHKEVLPRIGVCLDEMTKSVASIDFTSDSQKVIETFRSGYSVPADEIPIDFSVSDDSGSHLSHESTSKLSHNPSIRGSRRSNKLGTILRVKDMLTGRRVSSLPADAHNNNNNNNHNAHLETGHYGCLPPAQRLKKYQQTRSEMCKQLLTKQREREGLVKMQAIYRENPRFGEENTVDLKLRQTDEVIVTIEQEIGRIEECINELSENLNMSSNALKQMYSNSNISLDQSSTNGDNSTQTSKGESHKNLTAQGKTSVENWLTDDAVSIAPSSKNSISPNTPINRRDEEDVHMELVSIGRAIANYDFSNEGFGNDILPMHVGERMLVVEEDTGDGWTKIQKTDGSQGFVPTSYCVMRPLQHDGLESTVGASSSSMNGNREATILSANVTSSVEPSMDVDSIG